MMIVAGEGGGALLVTMMVVMQYVKPTVYLRGFA